MSEITKRALAASLKELMKKKSLSKITVADIAEDCGVNRHTFYYHFQDIYDLIEWIYQNETTKAIDGNKTYETWQKGFLQLFRYALENKAFVLGTYRSISKEYLLGYLQREVSSLMEEVIDEQAKDLKISREDKQFAANFYAFAFIGVAMDWIENDMRVDPDQIVEKLSVMLKGDFREALLKLVADRPK